MNIELRPATLEDVPAIAEIHVAGWRKAYREIMPADFLRDLSVEKRRCMWHASIEKGEPVVWIAHDESNVLGWAAFGRCRDAEAAPDAGEVWAMYLKRSRSEEFRWKSYAM